MIGLGRVLSNFLKIPSPYFIILMGGFETGMLGYSIFISLYGIEELYKIAVCDLGVAFFPWFFLMPILMKINEEERGFKQHLRLFATNPVIDGIILGIVLSVIRGFVPVTGNRHYEAVRLLLTTVGSMTVPLMCIIIGYGLRIQFSTIALLTMFVLPPSFVE